MLLEPTVLDPSEIQDVSSAPKSQPVPLDEDDIATESLSDPKAIVRRYATEAGLDPDLVHRVATQESGYNQNAISPKGAIGVMQLMPATAVRLGVNAYNLHQNIQGGVAELKRLVGKYGDVRKALAAYNAGEGAVDKYGGIPPYAETQNYVNTIAGQKPKPVPLDPSQIGGVQQPVALDENDIASIETPKPAPVVNVGAPGRNVGPAMTPDQLAAAEPWRKPTPNVPSYQQVTPEQADKGIARGAYQDRSLRTVYENLALNADVQKAFQQHAPRLAELEAKQKAAEDAAATPHGFEYQQPLTGPENRELASLRQERVNAQEAWQKQVEPQRQDDLISVAKAKWPANDAALAAFVQKHGPLTRDEQKLLGLPTNYLAQLPINIGAGLAQLGLGTAAGFERFVGSPANARDLEKLSGQVNTAEGVFGNQEVPGAVAHAAGGLLPQFALSAALPEFAPALAATGVIDPALFFGTSALEHYGQGASGEESLKAGVESLLPIAGAKFIGALAVGGPVLQMAQRIGGNAFANGLYTAANNGDSKAIATSFLMGGFMGFGHGESMDVPDDMIRAVITNPDIQSGVADILAKPKLFKQAIPAVEAKLKEAGLTDEQASQFTANLKTAAAASPESLAKENQNATALPEDQRVGTEVGQTTQGSEVNRSGNDQQTGNGVGESAATAGRSSGTEENKVASVKAFITRADEAELRNRGYSEDQIYKMKPDEAQRILESQTAKPAETTKEPPSMREFDHQKYGRVVETEDQSGVKNRFIRVKTQDGIMVNTPDPAHIRDAHMVEIKPTPEVKPNEQTPLPAVNEFEAPPKVSTGPVQNKSILEAVRALGRIQVDDDTVEGGELRQFGNKEQKGQGLVGPNGRLTPDLMREALEEAGFRDPNSNEPPGTPGSLSLDGMYELMDREQRGDKVYSAHRDSNLVDADLAKEYEQYRESGNEDAQFGHESGLEDEWRNPDSPLRQAYERIISGDDANGDEFVSVAQQYGISPESIEEHIQRATRTRESLPPVEVTPGGNDGRPEVAPEEGRITGIKNEITDRERAERGLSPIEKDIYDEFPKVFDDVKRGIDSGKIDIRGLTREWAEHPKGLSENEEAALIYDRARLYNNKEEIIDEITSAIASGDKAAEIEARVRLAPIEDAIVANEKAAVRSGTIWGRSGAMRQRMMKADYSLANIERRYRAKTGDSPTAEQSAKFKKLSEDLEDAQRAIAKRDDIISDLEARRWAKTEARKEAASGRRVKRAGSLDAIKKEWDGQKDALVRLLKLQGIGEPPAGGSKGLGGPEAGAVDPNLVTLPADVAKLLIEMARNRIRAGVTDAVDIVDSIHESIKDKFSVSARQISDAISGYGKQSKLSTDEVEVQLREVKRIRRLMSALEDAQKGEAPQRSGLKRDKSTRLVRELTRQVNEALRKNGYKLESADRSPEEQYQSALDGIKTRLRNSIEDLNKQIETGVKPEGRTPIPLDEEAKALVKERDGLRAVLEKMEGPRQTTEEQTAVARKNALRKQIDTLDRRLGGEPVPEKPSRTTNYDDETHALMAERDILRRQLQDPTTKNKETVRARLVEAERKLSQGDLARKEVDYPSSIYDDAETKGLKKQLQVTNKQISDARALPDKITKLEAQKAEVIRRLRERDFSKPESPNAPVRPVAPEIAKRQAELKDLNKQLASAKAEQNRVDAIQKRNAELRRRIREKDFTPTAKAPAKPVSPAVARLREERAGLQKEYDALKPTTDAERNAATEKALERSIADNEQRIADKRLMPDGKPEPADSPRIQELRKRNEEVKKALEELRKADPAVLAAREAAALKTYHKQLATREVEMTKTLADIKAGTYEPRAKRSIRNDPVSVEARARAGRIQDEIEKELLKAQLAKRNWTDKALDFAVKWRRNMLLSNPLTLAKLATAAASRVVISPVEEAAGGIIGQIPKVSKVAAKAPREGGFSVAAEAKAIYGYTRQLMQFAEAREIVRTGKTRLDTIYGAKGDLPPEAIEFFGRLHKLMKAPAQAAEFARSYQKRVEWALNNKMDPTDPVTQAALASSAYLDAQRAILMQDNAAVTYYRQVISRMRALDSTGKAAHPGYARALEMLLPIVKVPTNFVTETANYSLGLANALLKFRRAGWDANKLTPDEADSIMRSLKKQFVGQALFWMGYGFADKVGGYYQQGEKRKEGAPGAGEVQLFGRNIPHFFLHSPAMEVMQLGATFRHVMDAHADYSTLGKLGSGALAGAAGLSQQVPFIETPATIADAAKSDRKFGKFTANTVGGMFIPPVAKKIAEFQDSGVKRKPGSMGEDIEMMIPATRFNQGLSRKAVPTEEQRKDEQKQKRDDKKMNPDADKIYENRMKRKGLSP